MLRVARVGWISGVTFGLPAAKGAKVALKTRKNSQNGYIVQFLKIIGLLVYYIFNSYIFPFNAGIGSIL